MLDGAAYCLGAVNRDCWYLYTLNPYAAPSGHSLNTLLAGDNDEDFGVESGFEYSDGSDGSDGCDGSDGTDSSDDSLGQDDTDLSEQFRHRLAIQKRNVPRFPNRGLSPEADQTLEIMMSDLDPEVMKIFTKQVSATATEATQVFTIYFHIIFIKIY